MSRSLIREGFQDQLTKLQRRLALPRVDMRAEAWLNGTVGLEVGVV
jgi:hypothetical protein